MQWCVFIQEAGSSCPMDHIYGPLPPDEAQALAERLRVDGNEAFAMPLEVFNAN